MNLRMDRWLRNGGEYLAFILFLKLFIDPFLKIGRPYRKGRALDTFVVGEKRLLELFWKIIEVVELFL